MSKASNGLLIGLLTDYPSNPIAEAWGDPLRITLINVLILPDTSEGYLRVSEIGGRVKSGSI